MERQVVDRQLRRFVVRLEDPSTGRVWGSGVLVAPGWVLTCAHVVRDADEVAVAPDPRAGVDGVGPPPAVVPGVVRARSAPRPAGSPSSFWPYPDLAVVELQGWAGHVCAPLAADEPHRGSPVHAWGFGRREDDVAAVGGPASFDYVGQDGDGFLQLQAGEAPPGLSGAPLVCPTRRAVVGLMSVSRSVTAPRGGWASPITALTEADLDGPLADLGPRLLADNSAAALASRDAWARVLPIPGADETVERPWVGAVVDPATGQPSTMLRAEFAVVPYLPRGDELDRLQAWCTGPAPVAVGYIDAAGGSGKTRLAIEACRRMDARGWLTGFLPRQGRGAATLDTPRLLAVDYVEEHDAPDLAQQLAGMLRTATALAPARLLLLSRPAAGSPVGHAVDVLKDDASGRALTVLDAARDLSGAVAGLSPAQRDQIYATALDRFGRTWFGPTWTAPPTGAAAPTAPAGDSRPLDVLFAAFDAALTHPTGTPPHPTSGAAAPPADPGDPTDRSATNHAVGPANAGRQEPAPERPPVDRALQHEQRHWRRRVPDLPPAALPALADAVALATLCGAADDTDAAALLDLLPDLDPDTRARLARAVPALYGGPDRWNPLRPDRLGEALITQQLRQRPDHGAALLTAVLGLLSDQQLSRALTVLTRLAGDPTTAHPATAALLARHTTLTARCQQRLTPPGDPRSGLRLLDALTRAAAALLPATTLPTLPDTQQADLSTSLDILGRLARTYGRPRDARAVLTAALTLDHHRAASHPDNPGYRRNLAVAHSKLGDLDRDAGRPTAAATHYRHTLDAFDQLTRLDPDNPDYRQGLAVARERLRSVTGDVGAAGSAKRAPGEA